MTDESSEAGTALKIGDVVTLNSGSPYLTITQLHEIDDQVWTVTAVWFDDAENLQGADFPPQALRLVSRP